jgi:hypothetical protein
MHAWIVQFQAQLSLQESVTVLLWCVKGGQQHWFSYEIKPQPYHLGLEVIDMFYRGTQNYRRSEGDPAHSLVIEVTTRAWLLQVGSGRLDVMQHELPLLPRFNKGCCCKLP